MTSSLQGFGPQLLAGALMTLQLACSALIGGVILGLALAAAKLCDFSPLRWAAFALAGVFRALPELLVVLLLYFGLQAALDALLVTPIQISPFLAGAASLILIFGAASSEVFRSAHGAVPTGQMEAARACGMGGLTALWRVQLPQMVRHALPSLGNLWLSLLKDTSLVAVIGLSELMRHAQIATSVTKAPFTFYGAAALLYVTLSLASAEILRRLEARASRGLAVSR